MVRDQWTRRSAEIFTIVLFEAECVIYMKTRSAVPIEIIYHMHTPPGNLKCQNVPENGFVVQ